MKSIKRLLLLGLVGLLSGAPAAFAQDACPRPAGVPVNPLEEPAVTAAQAAGSAENLKAFSLAAKRYLASINPGLELAFSACLFRHEGPWKSGAIYVVTISTDGRVLFHSDNMALSGRPLKPAVWGAIAAATGATALPTTGDFGKPDGGALPAQIGGGYAVGFKRTAVGSTFLMAAGLDIGESHLAPETVDPGNPTIRADQVVDRATLKTFVIGATTYVGQLLRAGGRSGLSKAKSVLREPNGRWRHGPVYLFIMEPNGYTTFHGAFPDKFEFQAPTNTLKDQVTGKLILPKIIKAAQNPGGGFVKYYFDNPDDDSDSADVPKVTYAVQHIFRIPRPDGTTLEYPLIFGAGIYGDPDTLSQESVAAAQGWLARFGRTVGSQAVDMISGRMNAPARSGAKMTLGGQTVNLDKDSVRSLTTDGADSHFASLAQDRGVSDLLWSANRLTGHGAPETYRKMTMSDFLRGSSFRLTSAKGAEDAPGAHWSFWGRGAWTTFEGGAAAVEGDVTTAMLGMDYEKNAVLMGVALSRAEGEGGFDSGEVEATLTSAHPYLRYQMDERLSMWGIVGMGQGEMTLAVDEKAVETDLEMRMAAFGLRGELAKMGGFDLAVKSDVLFAHTESDAKDGLESISAEASRLRATLEASREVSMEGGGKLRPSVEASLRHDGGDGDEGTGVEVGGGLRFTNPDWGLALEVKARGLVTHAEEDVTDWGVGGMIRIAPGKSGRGLALTVRPEVGETASGAARLWGLQDASRLANGEIEDLDSRVRAEVGYGLDAWGGLLTPYLGLSVSEGGSGTYRLGGRFRVGERMSMSLEGDVRERENDDPAHGVALRGSLRW